MTFNEGGYVTACADAAFAIGAVDFETVNGDRLLVSSTTKLVVLLIVL